MIREFISHNQSPFIQELRKSIKLIEIEERMDLLIHRPIGLILTRIAIRLRLTPTQVSMLSLFTGIIAGILFYRQANLTLVLWGCFFLILSGILDTVDGQLARLTNQSSRLGMVIDGMVDTGVFIAVYAGACFYLIPSYGYGIFILAAISGYIHSIQSLIFDYYKHEFAFLYGNQDSYRNHSVSEIQPSWEQAKGFIERFIIKEHIRYIKRQRLFVTRKGAIKQQFEDFSKSHETQASFQQAYKETYSPFMVHWALWGGLNTHRTLIMIFCLMERFDYFLYVNLAMSIPIIITTILQGKRDKIFLKQFEKVDSKGNWIRQPGTATFQ